MLGLSLGAALTDFRGFRRRRRAGGRKGGLLLFAGARALDARSRRASAAHDRPTHAFDFPLCAVAGTVLEV
jgi:hypothetical protein